MSYLAKHPVYTSIGVECNEKDLIASINSIEEPKPTKSYKDLTIKTHHFSYSSIPSLIQYNTIKSNPKQHSALTTHQHQSHQHQSHQLQIQIPTKVKVKEIADVSSKFHRENLKQISEGYDVNRLFKEKLMRISLYDLYKTNKKDKGNKRRHRESIDCIGKGINNKGEMYYKTISATSAYASSSSPSTSMNPFQYDMSIMKVVTNTNESKSVFDNIKNIGINRKKKITIDCLRERSLWKETKSIISS